MKVDQNLRQLNITQLPVRNASNQGFKKQNQTNNDVKANPNFTGGFIPILNFLDTSPAWGACAVDFGFMVLPRTLTDFSRGPEVGVETMRREGMGTTNHASVCLYGAAAGAMVAAGINRAYQLGGYDNVKANNIYADSETLDMHGKIFDSKLRNNSTNPLRDYLVDTFKRYEALSANENGKWVRIEDSKVIDQVADVLESEISKSSNKMSKEGFAHVKNSIISALGVENNLRIIAEEGEKLHSSRYSVDTVIDNAYKLGKAFTSEKVLEAFHNSTSVAENAFLKALKGMNLKRSLLGVGIASAFGMAAQPINMYLTKRKTGSNKFVGGGEEDKSVGFKVRKSLVASLFGAGVLATIGNPKNLLKDIQFKGFTPTIKQLKFIYGLTIVSRFLASRNDNELKECSFKDTLGFANWLILGNFVQKLVAQTYDKSLIKKDGKGIINWIQNSSLKTRSELLHEALGDKVFKNGKALSFTEMLKALPKGSPVKKQLMALTVAQLSGYIYSGLVLGFGIPKLNAMLTNRREAKRKAAETVNNNISNVKSQEMMFKPENIAFLNNKNFTGMNLLNK